jgi:hypothetical protein
MKKKLTAIFLVLMFIGVCQSEAATTYIFEVSNVPYDSPPTTLTNISAFVADINGGAWELGTVFDRYVTDWGFDEGPGTYFGGADLSSAGDVPLINGPVVEIIALNDDPLTLSNFTAYTLDLDVNNSVAANLNPVPIPPTVLLLGAGLMGLVGIRRRVKS